MDGLNCANFIVLIIQVIVLIVELSFMKKTINMSKLSERGVLLLERTPNRNTRSGNSKDLFALEYPGDRFLLFYPNNKGVILKNVVVRIDGVETYRNKKERSIIYPLQSDEPLARVELDLSEEVLANEEFDCDIEFTLETFSSYKYVEVVEMTFTHEDERFWRLSKYGTHFLD